MGNGPLLYDRREKIKEGQWTGWQLYVHLEQELWDQGCKGGRNFFGFPSQGQRAVGNLCSEEHRVLDRTTGLAMGRFRL